MGWVRRAAATAIVDIGPLRRSRDYRLVYAGQTVSLVGTMITFVAVPYQMFRLTHSSLQVGLLGLAEFAPLVIAATAGGVLADARDRRRIILLTQVGRLVLSAGLVVNAAADVPQIWFLYFAAAAGSGLAAIGRPSLDAMVPRLVGRDDLAGVAALEGLQGTVAMIGGPALGGVLIATAGLPGAYGFDVASFAFSAVALRLTRTPPGPAPDRESGALTRAVEGFRYAWSRRELLGTYAVDLNAMFFGMPTALFPAFAARLGGGAAEVGLLYAAPAVGAMAATLGSAWVRRVHRHGCAILWAAGGWGLAIITFGLAPSEPVALGCLVVAGGADMVSGLFRMTMWNETVPDRLRGRLAAIELLSYTSGPSLGNVEAGTVASVAGVQASIVSGGILCVVGCTALARLLPDLRHYDNRRYDNRRGDERSGLGPAPAA